MEQAAFPFTEPSILTVSEVNERIKIVLEDTFFDIWIEGEISNLRTPASGHAYLTLKDEHSQIRAVLFKMQRRYLRFAPKDGMLVIARGRISLYEPRGEYQLAIDYMEPKGIGALQIAFEQLKARLAQAGLFDPARKRPLPMLPRGIGIVTSPTGAVIRDMLQILHRRFANLHVCIYPVRVQGDVAAEEISRGIEALNRYPGIDVIIVARGGGSLEDLWAFNEATVAQAIYASRIPVISAVGHEIDYTIADFVADIRAPTPSAAAELVIHSKSELQGELRAVAQRLERAIRHHLEMLRARLEACQQRRVLKDPGAPLRTMEQRIDDLSARLAGAIRTRLRLWQEELVRGEGAITHLSPLMTVGLLRERSTALEQRLIAAQRERVRREREELERLTATLQALSPLAVLARGYSICRHRIDGRVIREAHTVAPGMHIDVRLWQGSLQCTVETVMTKGSGNARTDV
ncbi:MAG TPA: exodeoxyribonuclease VII large subunit [Candidatus Tectomicrobia bacterium]|nr:exodeoxyribonuclease VII large subunit [Candidatus Tectomicrobia bacterium]